METDDSGPEADQRDREKRQGEGCESGELRPNDVEPGAAYNTACAKLTKWVVGVNCMTSCSHFRMLSIGVMLTESTFNVIGIGLAKDRRAERSAGVIRLMAIYSYSQPSTGQVWYYCSDPAGYYPTVTQYNTAWQTVPATGAVSQGGGGGVVVGGGSYPGWAGGGRPLSGWAGGHGGVFQGGGLPGGGFHGP